MIYEYMTLICYLLPSLYFVLSVYHYKSDCMLKSNFNAIKLKYQHYQCYFLIGWNEKTSQRYNV